VYDHQLSQAELKATVTLHDEIDLEDMDEEEEEKDEQQKQQQQTNVAQHPGHAADGIQMHYQQQQQQEQEHQVPAAATSCVRSYPCRCGDSYLLRPADMQLAAHEIILPCR
jgi:hypothetical protein